MCFQLNNLLDIQHLSTLSMVEPKAFGWIVLKYCTLYLIASFYGYATGTWAIKDCSADFVWRFSIWLTRIITWNIISAACWSWFSCCFNISSPFFVCILFLYFSKLVFFLIFLIVVMAVNYSILPSLFLLGWRIFNCQYMSILYQIK